MEEQLKEIESVAFFLRGLWLDPAVPKHAKDAIMSRAELLEKCIKELGPLNDLYEELQFRMASLEK